MSKDYTYNASCRIWQKPEASSIAYSDGDDAENHLLETLRKARDVSSTSAELAAAVRDWPSEYHFSPARHNLLRFLDIGPHHTVLELGCGCGAMTRFLGESGATVIAVEGSERRARIAAERCRDLPNVSIYFDNLADFRSGEKFDYVTLIGVLEYAQDFIDAEDPVIACLERARSFLNEKGALVLAIENQLGLKYFNGCAEDHLGIPYYGINDLYGKTGPVTFGKHTLSHKLSMGGFIRQEFYFPFPDYKLPGLILSEAALRDDRLNVADLLIQNSGRCHPESHQRAFAEDQAWQAVVRNNLLPDLSNSFLVVAHLDDAAPQQADWMAKIYGRGNRRPGYQVESTILPDGAAALMVRKRRLFPEESGPQGKWLKHVVADCPYHSGRLLVGKIRAAMAREAGIDELAACFAPWLQYLLAHAGPGQGDAQHLPGSFVDCTPANLIQPQEGGLIYIDAEWHGEDTVPLAWVVTRGIFNSMSGCLENSSLAGLNYSQLILRIAHLNGIDLSVSDLDTAAEMESRLVANCFSNVSTASPYVAILAQPVFGYYRLSNNLPELRPQLEWHRYELDRVKSTISWRITAPLRVAWNLLRRFLGKARQA